MILKLTYLLSLNFIINSTCLACPNSGLSSSSIPCFEMLIDLLKCNNETCIRDLLSDNGFIFSEKNYHYLLNESYQYLYFNENLNNLDYGNKKELMYMTFLKCNIKPINSFYDIRKETADYSIGFIDGNGSFIFETSVQEVYLDIVEQLKLIGGSKRNPQDYGDQADNNNFEYYYLKDLNVTVYFIRGREELNNPLSIWFEFDYKK